MYRPTEPGSRRLNNAPIRSPVRFSAKPTKLSSTTSPTTRDMRDQEPLKDLSLSSALICPQDRRPEDPPWKSLLQSVEIDGPVTPVPQVLSPPFQKEGLPTTPPAVQADHNRLALTINGPRQLTDKRGPTQEVIAPRVFYINPRFSKLQRRFRYHTIFRHKQRLNKPCPPNIHDDRPRRNKQCTRQARKL